MGGRGASSGSGSTAPKTMQIKVGGRPVNVQVQFGPVQTTPNQAPQQTQAQTTQPQNPTPAQASNWVPQGQFNYTPQQLANMNDQQAEALLKAAYNIDMPNHLKDSPDGTQELVYALGLNAPPTILDSTQFSQFMKQNNIPRSQVMSRQVGSGTYNTTSGRMSNYWEKRAARQMHNQMQKAEDYAKDLAKYYIAASRHLQSEQNAILRQFALTHHMTIKEAEVLISSLKDPSSIKELIKALKKDPKNAELVREFEAQAARSRIMRLNALQSQVTYTAGQIQILLNKKAQKLFVNLARSAYYNTMFDAMQRAGYGFNVKMLDPKRIKRVMDRSWTGAGFSKRLWSNTKALEDAVKREIMVNLLTGRPLIKASQAINEEFGKGYNNARRLIRTESAYITNQMTLEGYKDLEADKYIYVAILDLKTSEVCRGLDKKRFPVKSAKVGVNYPPMHPWCRSTTIPWMPDHLLKNMKQRALDPKTGKHVLVPGDMTYEQWYDKFVKRANEFESVFDEYRQKATPGKGKKVVPIGRKFKNREKQNMDMIHDTLGGDIIALKEGRIPKKKYPDFMWNHRYWEEQDLSSHKESAIDLNMREGIHQIRKDPGGVILDIGDTPLDMKTVRETILNRARRSAGFNFDIMVIRNGKIEDILRYNKK